MVLRQPIAQSKTAETMVSAVLLTNGLKTLDPIRQLLEASGL